MIKYYQLDFMKQFNRFVFFMMCVFAALIVTRAGEARRGISSINALTAFSPPPEDTLHGLIGSYYNDPTDNSTWFTTLILTRVDTAILFPWGSGSPDPRVGTSGDHFSVRWVGLIEAPVTGTYTVTTNTDDGHHLYINGLPVGNQDDDWANCCADKNGTIDLVAGKKYPIGF